MALTNYMGVPKVYNPETGQYEEPDMKVLADLLGAAQGQSGFQADVRRVDNNIADLAAREAFNRSLSNSTISSNGTIDGQPSNLVRQSAGLPPVDLMQLEKEKQLEAQRAARVDFLQSMDPGSRVAVDYDPATGAKKRIQIIGSTAVKRENQPSSAAAAQSPANLMASINEKMKRIVEMGQPGYSAPSSDPAYSSVVYERGMTPEQIAKSDEYKQLHMLLGLQKEMPKSDLTPYEKKRQELLAESEAAKINAGIAGTPENERLKKAEVAQSANEKAKGSAVTSAMGVLAAIENAKSKVGSMTTGIAGSALGLIPGTESRQLIKALDPIIANIGFDRLQRMREESTTGGALGQVAVQELNMLQSTLGSLDPSQGAEGLTQSLDKVKWHYQRYLAAMEEAYNAGEFKTAPKEFLTFMGNQRKLERGQQGQQQTGAPKVGVISKGYIFLGGDPGNKASWKKVD